MNESYMPKELNCINAGCFYIKREKTELPKGSIEMEIYLGFIYFSTEVY